MQHLISNTALGRYLCGPEAPTNASSGLKIEDEKKNVAILQTKF